MCIVLYFFNEHPTSTPKENWSVQKEYYFFTDPQSLKTIFLLDIEEAQEISLIYLTVNENKID